MQFKQSVSDVVKMSFQDRQGVSIRLISNLSKRDPLVTISKEATINEALELFTSVNEAPSAAADSAQSLSETVSSSISEPSLALKKTVHRLILLDNVPSSLEHPSKFLGLVSQSSIISYSKFCLNPQSLLHIY
jgi:hypothetical protein